MQYDAYFSWVPRNGRCIMYAQHGWVLRSSSVRLPSGERPDASAEEATRSLRWSLVGE